MFGLDQRIAELGSGGSLLLALAVAVLLGLRHATDPDHLTAVSVLVLGDRRSGARRARLLGLAWGAGHATTLVLLGLPVVAFGRLLPDAIQRAAELTVGIIIVALALRLLQRWRRGSFHAHPHEHGDLLHAHPHVHDQPRAVHARAHAGRRTHEHAHDERLGRSPRAAFAVGLVHGAGGSAGVGVLLISAMPDRRVAAAALLLFAAATAVSMALVSAAWGEALARRTVARRLGALVPLLGLASLVFGAWYAVSAVG